MIVEDADTIYPFFIVLILYCVYYYLNFKLAKLIYVKNVCKLLISSNSAQLIIKIDFERILEGCVMYVLQFECANKDLLK